MAHETQRKAAVRFVYMLKSVGTACPLPTTLINRVLGFSKATKNIHVNLSEFRFPICQVGIIIILSYGQCKNKSINACRYCSNE